MSSFLIKILILLLDSMIKNLFIRNFYHNFSIIEYIKITIF